MKHYLRSLFILVVSLLFLTKIEANEAALKKPLLAPEFSLQDLEENSFSLSNYKDKQPLILFFWTTWCPFCRKELSALNQKHQELEKEGWVVWAINVDESSDQVASFVKNHKFNFKVLLDKDASVADSLDVFGVPTYIIIDKGGQVVFKDHYFPEAQYKELI